MEWLISAVIFSVIIAALAAYLQFVKKRKMLLDSFKDLETLNYEIDYGSHDNKIYDIILKRDNCVYLFKFIYYLSKNYELSVNARDYFQVNEGKIGSKRAGSKLPKVYDLMNYDASKVFKGKKVKKIYVVCPSAHNLVKVVNESEIVKITPHTDVYGCRFLNHLNLVNDFKEVMKEDFKDEI